MLRKVKKKKTKDSEWQLYKTLDYSNSILEYIFEDKFIEAEESYDYCISPVAYDENGIEVQGQNTVPQTIYIQFDHAHMFDTESNFDMIYDLEVSPSNVNIGANVIDTLGAKYPVIIYGNSAYKSGSISFTLVTEESATGRIDLKSEKTLRENLYKIFCNKKPKILKNSDGGYILISIIGTPSFIPNNNLLGSYKASFEYVEVGNANDVQTLVNLGLVEV